MMLSGASERTKLLAMTGIVALVLSMVAATLALLVVAVVQAAYFDFDRETWLGFVLPPALWAVFCAASLWAIVKLTRILDKPAWKKTVVVAGILAMGLVGLAVAVLYTS